MIARNVALLFTGAARADDTPLARETHASVKGRAFLVASFEAVDDTRNTYAVVGDRLLALRSDNPG